MNSLKRREGEGVKGKNGNEPTADAQRCSVLLTSWRQHEGGIWAWNHSGANKRVGREQFGRYFRSINEQWRGKRSREWIREGKREEKKGSMHWRWIRNRRRLPIEREREDSTTLPFLPSLSSSLLSLYSLTFPHFLVLTAAFVHCLRRETTSFSTHRTPGFWFTPKSNISFRLAPRFSCTTGFAYALVPLEWPPNRPTHWLLSYFLHTFIEHNRNVSIYEINRG